MDAVHIPAGALVVLSGPPGSGKSTWAQRQVADGALGGDQVVRVGVRSELNMAQARVDAMLRAGRTVVCDGPNIATADRTWMVESAERHEAPVYAVRFDLPINVLRKRNARRDSPLPDALFSTVMARWAAEGAAATFTAEGFTPVDGVGHRVTLLPSGWDGRHISGGFDVIGDVHGCLNTLKALLEQLGYDHRGRHKDGRIPVFVGDVHDKGLHNLDTLEFVMALDGIEVLSNHAQKLRRVLAQALASCRPEPTDETLAAALTELEANLGGGLDATIRDIRDRPDCLAVTRRIVRYIDRLPDHVVLDGGALAVAHAGASPDMLGHSPDVSREARDIQRRFLYGPGSVTDELGNTVGWVEAWDSDTVLVHGHTVQNQPRVRGNVVSVDTGCCSGGGLTAWSWPERTFTTERTHATDLPSERSTPHAAAFAAA